MISNGIYATHLNQYRALSHGQIATVIENFRIDKRITIAISYHVWPWDKIVVDKFTYLPHVWFIALILIFYTTIGG